MSAKCISIIIPIYNSESYLYRCLDSVLSQSYKNIEIILINDGSVDRSGEICNDYANRDKRIKVIHQQNKGVSVARNVGLDIATGDYVTFVDSDDWLGSEYISTLVACMDLEDSDIIITNGTKVINNKYIVNKFDEIGLLVNNEIDISSLMYNGYAWGKLYRADMIKEKNIRFNVNLSLWEDLVFMFEYISFAKKIYFTNNIYYYYNDIPNSLSSRNLTFKETELILQDLLISLNRIYCDKISNSAKYQLSNCIIYQLIASNYRTLPKLSSKDRRHQLNMIHRKYPELVSFYSSNLFKKKYIYIFDLIYSLRFGMMKNCWMYCRSILHAINIFK